MQVCYKFFIFFNFHFRQKWYVILKRLWRLCKVLGYWTIVIIAFYEIFIKFKCFFNPFKVISSQVLWHCPTIQIIYILIFQIWPFFISIIIFHVFVITFFILINSVTFIFLIKRSNFTLVFFKAACHSNHCAVRKRAGSSSYILRHIFQNFSNTSANNNVSFWIYKWWYSPKYFI